MGRQGERVGDERRSRKRRRQTGDEDATAAGEEWGRDGQSYQSRIDHLTGASGGGNNGSVQLIAATVFDDSGAADELLGGLLLDWFITSPGDSTDAAADEIVTMV